MIEQLEKEIGRAYPDRLTWQKCIPTFHPESADEAADIFERAARFGQKLCISGFANTIDPVGKPFADLLVLKSDRLNMVVEVNSRDFHITVGAGFPVNEINRIIAPLGLWFPFGDVQYPGSFGGALATGLTAGDGVHTVPFSRHLLSVTAALPDGTIVHPGALTFKSVSGYDISRLFCNSWGCLGMVIRLSFRVLPLSQKEEGSSRPTLLEPDREAFARRMAGDEPMAKLCRKIKNEFDPHGLLPII
ncbi:MAG: FAD-binding oxidoreductase [candidate division Zixibacteria bacterium]|nr:FAD-binding oxidoreductase [candidate division Zixibacteria bacterium]